MLENYCWTPPQTSLQWDKYKVWSLCQYLSPQNMLISNTIFFNLIFFSSLSLPALYSFVLLFQGIFLALMSFHVLRHVLWVVFSPISLLTWLHNSPSSSRFSKVQNLTKSQHQKSQQIPQESCQAGILLRSHIVQPGFQIHLELLWNLELFGFQIALLIFLSESALEYNCKLLSRPKNYSHVSFESFFDYIYYLAGICVVRIQCDN